MTDKTPIEALAQSLGKTFLDLQRQFISLWEDFPMTDVTPENVKELADEIEDVEGKLKKINSRIRNIENTFDDEDKTMIKDFEIKFAHYENGDGKRISNQRLELSKYINDEETIIKLILMQLKDKREEYREFLNSIPEKLNYNE